MFKINRHNNRTLILGSTHTTFQLIFAAWLFSFPFEFFFFFVVALFYVLHLFPPNPSPSHVGAISCLMATAAANGCFVEVAPPTTLQSRTASKRLPLLLVFFFCQCRADICLFSPNTFVHIPN